MQEANYFKCTGCGYEFLSNAKNPVCPRCNNGKLERRDAKEVAGFDE